MYDEFFSKASELRDEGTPFATAVVVRAEAPSSAKPGDKAIVTLDGVMHGWIGGSCAQPAVVEEAIRAIADGECRLLRLTPEPGSEALRPGMEERPMTCYSGGTLEVYIEPQQPQPVLLIVGHLPVARALAHLGRAMSYRVVAVDPTGEGVAMAHADARSDLGSLAEFAGPLTYVVIASHGHVDESALLEALRLPVPYVGLVASPRRAQALRERLESAGLAAAHVAKLKAPAGLDIGASRGDEIALSIMAEIVQHRRQQAALDWLSAGMSGKESAAMPTERARDPVCGMEVMVENAAHSCEKGGQRYYFCCDGCRQRFEADPVSYGVCSLPDGSDGLPLKT